MKGFIAGGCLLMGVTVFGQQPLADKILNDARMDTVEARALRLLNGFTAGTSYGEIWIRDFNTFIDGSLKVHKQEEVREMLLLFFRIQGEDGNIPDGAIHKEQANVGYNYKYSPLAPGWATHKIPWRQIRSRRWCRR